MAKCVSCNSKKGKRNCPALGDLICSQCCGIKRMKEIDCPDDCFYLDKSKQYFTDRQETQKMAEFEKEMKKTIGNEQRYLDILQNIEFAIVNTFTKRPDLTDGDVETALQYLFEMGKAQLDLPSKFLTKLPPNAEAVVEAVDNILKFRDEITGNQEQVNDKLKSIYRVLDSVKTHYNPSDPVSYLNFVRNFV